jgi:hypothetical protein
METTATVDTTVISVGWVRDEQGAAQLLSVVQCSREYEAWILRFQVLPSLEMILPMRALGREEILTAATNALRQYLSDNRALVEALVRAPP